MKNLLLVSLLAVSFFQGCKNDFNPVGDSKEIYAFTCILKGDNANQIATLSQLYTVNGYDPYVNTIDPSVIDADVRVRVGDSVYVFRDTTAARVDTTRYSTPSHYYFNDNFIVAPNNLIEVEILLKNGKRLKAATNSPKEIFLNRSSDKIIPPIGNDLVNFAWNEQADPIMFAPRLTIRYLQNINGTMVEKIKIVPIKYVEQNGKLLTFFPQPSNKVSVIYQLDAISRAMQEISEGDPNKSNYSIFQKQVFSVTAFDLNLSRYVSSTTQSFDDLTVTVNASDYTNIAGGLGIFGCYTKQDLIKLDIQKEYIESFGYNYRVGE